MNNVKQVVLTVLVTLTSTLTAIAYDFEVDGLYYNVLSREELTCEVAEGFKTYNGDIVIPETVTVAGRTFSITAIGKRAFANSSFLKSVVIPKTITVIEEDAFLNCGTVENSLIIKISDLSAWCNIHFSGWAWNGSPRHYFYLNDELLTNITIPDDIKEIKQYTFSWGSFESVTIPETVNKICYEAFFNSIIKYINIPESVLSIEDAAFSSCYYLERISIPNELDIIKAHTFSHCGSLKEIVLPNNISTIESCAFQWSGIERITLPKSVNKIEENALSNCKNLQEVISYSIIPPTASSSSFEGSNLIEAKLKVPAESLELYKEASGWKDFWNIEALTETGIEAICGDDVSIGKTFDLNGREASAGEKGIMIQSGKKVLKK